ncbi:putative dehydrogenase [Flavobacterium sp. CG_23.5]|uniref:Gfo/Idh/MocA family protein n=1 Tax=Flavobacterium sp. CG_23.5 TaxID=2760708 RepID=UPI001AEB9052|nr:Gfo/Idh/MocA family oxidoreductase [Flavobacterium sp. CG_23.5]MBP2283037.1 putative dehydrogenase [Flavobacterium sp. CG_23.5]
MKILIIGTGSIGMRHLQNCLTIDRSITIDVVSRGKTSLEGLPEIKIFNTIAEAFDRDNFYDAAIVATPTSLHIENCIDLIHYGLKKIYVEKPIAPNLEDIETLMTLSKTEKVSVYVGFDLRFDIGLNKVKELLGKKVIGNLISFQAEVGQYLPDWRIGTNYKEGMSAKTELGGGVMLDLIHEFDYLSWLLGGFQKAYGLNQRIDHLDIETEGISVNIIQTNEGVLGVLSLDYIQKKLNRFSKFIGDNGTIEWNYVTAEVKWSCHSDLEQYYFEYKNVERNDRFIAILDAFLKARPENFDSRLTPLEEGISSLETVLAAKNFNNSVKSKI